MNKVVIRRSERIYWFLLKFYPKSYRQEFGEEMKYVFSELMKDAYREYGGQGIIRVWAKTIIDTGKSLIIQYVENQEGGENMSTKNIYTKNITKRLAIWAIIVAGILMLPLVARAPWTTGDFIFAAVALFGCASLYEIVTRKMTNKNHRIAVGIAVAMVIFLIWGWAVA